MENSLRILIITNVSRLKYSWNDDRGRETRHSIDAKSNNSTTGHCSTALYAWKWFADITCDNAFLILICRARLLRWRIIVMRIPEVSSYARARPDPGSLCYVNRDSSPASDDFHPSKLIFVMRTHIALLKKKCDENRRVRARSLRAAWWGDVCNKMYARTRHSNCKLRFCL